MAIKHKELIDKLQSAPLTKSQLEYIGYVEKYIDEEILKQYKDSGNTVRIPLGVAKFEYTIDRSQKTNFSKLESRKMHDELVKRYVEAGWSSDFHIDDGLDGPNRSGSDYWILKD